MVLNHHHQSWAKSGPNDFASLRASAPYPKALSTRCFVLSTQFIPSFCSPFKIASGICLSRWRYSCKPRSILGTEMFLINWSYYDGESLPS